jgi:hypothetical protein
MKQGKCSFFTNLLSMKITTGKVNGNRGLPREITLGGFQGKPRVSNHEWKNLKLFPPSNPSHYTETRENETVPPTGGSTMKEVTIIFAACAIYLAITMNYLASCGIA